MSNPLPPDGAVPPPGEWPADPLIDDMATPGPRTRPAGLSAICILMAILAASGLSVGCFGLISQAFATQFQEAMSKMQPMPNAQMAEAQKEMNQKIQALTSRYNWAMIPLQVLKMGAEVLILAGAVLALGWKPLGRSWLAWGLLAAIFVEGIMVVPTLMLQLDMQAVMKEVMPKMMQGPPGAPAPPPAIGGAMSQVATIAVIVTAVFGLLWQVIKIVCYALSIRYLRKPETLALFTSPAAHA